MNTCLFSITYLNNLRIQLMNYQGHGCNFQPTIDLCPSEASFRRFKCDKIIVKLAIDAGSQIA